MYNWLSLYNLAGVSKKYCPNQTLSIEELKRAVYCFHFSLTRLNPVFYTFTQTLHIINIPVVR